MPKRPMHALPPHQLQALIIQDLKTEDDSQPGGFARRRVQKGSVVVVRGSDDKSGNEATWVALVNKVGGGGLRCWCQRKGCGMQSSTCRLVRLDSSLSLHPPPLLALTLQYNITLQVYRGKKRELRVGVTWFNRKSDIPAKEARRAKLAGDGPRQVGVRLLMAVGRLAIARRVWHAAERNVLLQLSAHHPIPRDNRRPPPCTPLPSPAAV